MKRTEFRLEMIDRWHYVTQTNFDGDQQHVVEKTSCMDESCGKYRLREWFERAAFFFYATINADETLVTAFERDLRGNCLGIEPVSQARQYMIDNGEQDGDKGPVPVKRYINRGGKQTFKQFADATVAGFGKVYQDRDQLIGWYGDFCQDGDGYGWEAYT